MSRAEPRNAVQVLEKGNIVFFYRPKEGVLHPRSPDDLERVYLMLLPDDQTHHRNRVLNVTHGVFPMIVPGKALPEERDWAFVQDVSQDPKKVLEDLQKNISAPPEPSGQRARPWARPAGQGRYEIVEHDKHTHLAYRLSQPTKPGEVQAELQVKPEASYVISVKEPYAPSEIALSEKPSYPESLRNKFDGHGWIPLDPTDFLDYRWTQVLLIGARANVEKELGIKLSAAAENKAEREVLEVLRKEAKQAEKQGISLLEPLKEGQWQ